jgi:hypothetical protein
VKHSVKHQVTGRGLYEGYVRRQNRQGYGPFRLWDKLDRFEQRVWEGLAKKLFLECTCEEQL